ncbi:unnamed protein product, partial [marine sediment metagenome]
LARMDTSERVELKRQLMKAYEKSDEYADWFKDKVAGSRKLELSVGVYR